MPSTTKLKTMSGQH